MSEKFKETVLNFNDGKNEITEVENLETTYVPKTDHQTRMRLLRLEAMKNKMNQRVK
jgi:hypothetical protein